jgi:very-short-patch-repair endonuclease
MTAPEIILWAKLKGSQIGYKFRRQHGIGQYIVDFYCSEKKLAVEIDGDSHFEEKTIKYDKQRQEFIESNNIRVVRFTNKDIMENIEGVLEIIINYLKL